MYGLCNLKVLKDSWQPGEDEYIQIYPFLDITKHYIMSVIRSKWPICPDQIFKLLNMNTRHENQQVYKFLKNIHTAPQDRGILKI